MSEKKAGFPMFPMWDASEWDWSDCGWDWDWSSRKEKAEEKSQEFKADFKARWEKAIDMQKSSIDGSKGQYEQFFAHMMDLQDDFAEALPEELPWMPSWVQSPKSVRKSVKEFQKMANEHFIEQADAWTGFWIESQEKACAQIPDAEESAK